MLTSPGCKINKSLGFWHGASVAKTDVSNSWYLALISLRPLRSRDAAKLPVDQPERLAGSVEKEERLSPFQSTFN